MKLSYHSERDLLCKKPLSRVSSVLRITPENHQFPLTAFIAFEYLSLSLSSSSATKPPFVFYAFY